MASLFACVVDGDVTNEQLRSACSTAGCTSEPCGDGRSVTVPRSLFSRGVRVELTPLSGGFQCETRIVFRGSWIQCYWTCLAQLAIGGWVVVLLLRESLRVASAWPNQEELTSLPVPYAGLAMLVTALLVVLYETRQRLCLTRDVVRALSRAGRVPEYGYLSAAPVIRDLLSTLVLSCYWAVLWMVMQPPSLRIILGVTTGVWLAALFVSVTQHPLVGQRMLALRALALRALDSICIAAFGLLSMAWVVLYVAVVASRRMALPWEQASIGDGRRIVRHVAATIGTLSVDGAGEELHHAMELIAISSRHELMPSLSDFVLCLAIGAFLVLAFLLVLSRRLSRGVFPSQQAAGTAVLLSTAPEARSRVTALATAMLFLVAAVHTILPLLLFAVGWGALAGAEFPHILGIDPANPVVWVARLSPLLGAKGRIAFLFTALTFMLPGALILLELGVCAYREARIWRQLLHPAPADVDDLRTLQGWWRGAIPNHGPPALMYSTDLRGPPEVRSLLLPPFQYVALPDHFRPAILDGLIEPMQAAMVLAHEDYHVRSERGLTFVLRLLGFVFLRYPALRHLLTTGEDELAADTHACAIVEADDGRQQLGAALQMVQFFCRARQPARTTRRKSLRSLLLAPASGLFMRVSPPLSWRLSALDEEVATPPQVRGQRTSRNTVQSLVYVLFAFLPLAIVVVCPASIRHHVLALMAKPETEQILGETTGLVICDVAASPSRVFVLRRERLQLVNPRDMSIADGGVLPEELVNPSVVVPLGDDRCLVGSAWRGAWLWGTSGWNRVHFPRAHAPAVLGAARQPGTDNVLLATSAGLWGVSAGSNVARLVWEHPRPCRSVAFTTDCVLVGAADGLYGLNAIGHGSLAPVRLLPGGVLSVAARNDVWVVARDLGPDSRTGIVISGSHLAATSLWGLAGGGGQGDHVADLYIDTTGRSWVLQSAQGCSLATCREGTTWRSIDSEDRKWNPRAITDSAGYLFVANGARLERRDAISLAPDTPPPSAPTWPVVAIDTDRDGQLWLATEGWIWRLGDDEWMRCGRAGVPDARWLALPLFTGCRRRPGVWAADEHTVINQIGSGNAKSWGIDGVEMLSLAERPDGAPLALDQDGGLWTASGDRLSKFCQLPLGSRQLSQADIAEVGGVVWIVEPGAVWRVDIAESESTCLGLPDIPGFILDASERGCSVVGLNGSVFLLGSEGEAYTRCAELPGTVSTVCRSYLPGVVLVACNAPTTIYRWHGGKMQTLLGQQDGLPSGIVQMAVDSHGAVWVVDLGGNLWRTGPRLVRPQGHDE
jgi:hypothetical protein